MTPESWDNPWTELLERARIRIFGLFLQAAHREGVLPQDLFRVEDDLLIWESRTTDLRVRGRSYSGGHRLRVTSLAISEERRLDFQESILKIGELSGLSPLDGAWKALREELTEGVRVQAAAYQAALERPEPQSWEALECWTPEGHNLHPGAKTREGFSVEDQLAYSPDFASTLRLPWISVEKALLQASGEVPKIFDLGDRWAVPVHPWQRREVLPKAYAEEWAEDRIADLEREPVEAYLSTSLRTVTPVDPKLPILKLSVGSLMTSTERSMSRHTVLQGPVYSELLRRVFERAPVWSKGVTILEEPGGLCWSDGEDQTSRTRQLSLLFRRRPETPSGWLPVPCSSLPQPSGKNLSSRLWAEYFSRGAGATANFERYCQILIPFHLGLMMEFGLALEAHLQNCVVLWSKDRPEALWVRDWGGLRADSEKVRELFPDLWEQLDPASVTLTDAVAARRKLLACLYSNHLTEVVGGLAAQFGLEESALWSVVARITRESLEPWGDSPLAREILVEPWSVKSLLRLRLGAKGEDYRALPNPLSDVNLSATSSLDTGRAPEVISLGQPNFL